MGDLDDLHSPEGAIAEAQALAADALGADESHFLVNGASSGIHAAILACAHRGKVVVPRNVHRSVVGALALSGARPVYVMPEFDRSTGIAGGLSTDALKRALDENDDVSAVLMLHPVYYGITGDTRSLVDLAHERGIPVILDEAHGAHFAFHAGYPLSGMQCGADVGVVGFHKTAGAFTQGAILNVQGALVDRDLLRACLRTVQTTSPSYLLMASLDASRKLMATVGNDLLGYAMDLSEAARHRIGELGVFHCPGDEWTGRTGFYGLDRTKLTVLTPWWGDGRDVERELAHRFGILVEFAAPGHFLAVVTYADDEATTGRLVAALEMMALEGARWGNAAVRGIGEGGLAGAGSVPLHLPEQAVPPGEALFGSSEWLEVSRARGAVSADVVAIYPPGIPALCPGEIIDGETVEFVERAFRGGWRLHGVRRAGDVAQIRVLQGRNWTG